MSKKIKILLSILIILYVIVINISIPKELTFNGFEHNEEEILNSFDITVSFKTGLTWNFKQEYTIKSVLYLGNTYEVTGNVLDFDLEFSPFPNPVYLHDSPNYKFNIVGFRSSEKTYITGYRIKDGGLNSQGVRIY